MVPMPLLPTLGRTVGTGVKAVRLMVRGSVRGGAWATRRIGTVRARGAANEIGMIRLFDLHAVSCAGDALIAIGLAGTIFSVPLGEARGKAGLYLLITMVPFALLAPVVGPLLDHFRHGRRYALAVTMLGRAFLAYVMSNNLTGWALYPAAFGVLALSRAYGVARSAAVPRLLPAGVGLSQVGARASVYGTFAGALVAPIGLLAFRFGPQWPMRVAIIIFAVGMVVALRLPPRADSDPPEAMPRAWRTVLGLNRGSDRPLSGRLVLAALFGSAGLRLIYGFLLLFLTFAIMAGDVQTTVLGRDLGKSAAVGVVGGALALGTFLSTAAGTGLRIRRPLALQSSGLVITAGAAILATVFYNLVTVALLALLTAVFSGIAKLAVDASIQERVPERLRATAFAHSETVLMLAWVTGGGLGLIPLTGRPGIALAALLAVLAAARATWSTAHLHNERLAGRPEDLAGSAEDPSPSGTSSDRSRPDDEDLFYEAADPWPDAPAVPDEAGHGAPRQRRAAGDRTLDPTLEERRPAPGWWTSRRRRKPAGPAPTSDEPTRRLDADTPAGSPSDPGDEDHPAAPPGYHVYRPSSGGSATRNGD
ncbi:MFS transporter [Actinoplanes regularis]|uniref:MFS transporter n=1 Tax=Actinoplanes regularis TaxID=52697 RepID=UPI003D7F7BA3